MSNVTVGGRVIGHGQPCFVIAEAGVNHNGDIALAHQLIDAAVACGADAVKFQSFVTEDLITLDAPKTNYQVETTGATSQYAMLKALEFGEEEHAALKEHCEQSGILYLCTPYETKSVDMLDRLGVAAYKIASTDTTNIPFLRYIAAKGRPVILSTGMSTLAEVEQAVDALVQGGVGNKTIILHCTAEYPAPVEEANLRAMQTLHVAFGCPIGFSDHTRGIGASPWAVVLGATAIEKHFTLDKAMSGPDHRSSLDPGEFAELLRTIRLAESALGDGVKRPVPSEMPNKPYMQKSVVARHPIAQGHVICAEDLTAKRPGLGLAPLWFDKIVGKQAARAVPADAPLSLADVVWE